MAVGQNDGVENEKQIVGAFNERQIKVLTAYQQAFIKQLYKNASDTDVVHAKKVGGQGFKPDVEIDVDGEKYSISVKKGGGNSVHQEKTELFLHYCVQTLDMTEEERDSLLLFLYGDGTTDGDSLPEERLKDQELVDTYKTEIEIVQRFLDRNKRNLLERFLVYGRLGRERGIKADYIYHGDAKDGVWCPLDYDAIDYLAEVPNAPDAPLAIGPLTIQVWNRNLEGKPEMEQRRHSIQVKWGACKTYIEKINQIYLENLEKRKAESVSAVRTRTLGDNRQGFENQDNLITLMNNHRVSELDTAVKNIVMEIYPHAAGSEIVRAAKVTGNDVKPRLSISVNGDKKNLTVFMGSGNSVHQEKLANFLEYCRAELGISREEEDAFLTIMYGDGTTDGDSDPEDRLPNTEAVKRKYKKQNEIAQAFFNRNKKALIERFLIYGKGGKQKNIKADYIYYGTDVTGRLVAYATVIEYLMSKEGSESALLSLGSLTTQPWNRNPEGKANLEDRRHSLQIKWGGMKQDLSAIIENIDEKNKGTADGDWEEYELVSRLNRDKRVSNRLWSTICERLDIMNLDNVYAVRVSNMVYSSLSDRMVLPKADVYLIRGNISHEVLLDNNYWLDEDVISGLEFRKIDGSGISCKRPSSKNFTYAKFTINSFEALFKDKCIGAAISLFVSEKDLVHNSMVLEKWGVKKSDILKVFSMELSGNGISLEKQELFDLDVCKILKSSGINRLANLIKQNRGIAEAVFYGKGLYEEPYTANFTYISGNVSTTYIPEFSITTGSGRHRGVFTIVIKPV